MIFEELRSRYGASLAVQVMEALTPQAFDALELEEVSSALSQRAAQAYRAYCDHLENTPIQAAERDKLVEVLNQLRQKWQEAEELSYYVLEIDLNATPRLRRIVPTA